MIFGVILGFSAALFQSASYICGRLFSSRFNNNTLELLSLSHIIMAVFSLAALPLIIASPMPALSTWILKCAACTIFYLVGQFCLLMALQHASASRISPLLGLKVFMLAVIGIAVLNQQFNLIQWLAIALTVFGAYVLSYSGEKLKPAPILWVLAACFCFCISDLNIKLMVHTFEHAGLFKASFTSACLTYIFCGLVGLAVLPFLPKPTPAMWLWSAPFAVTWFISMLFLFSCFATIGVVFGNIIQSTRGIISVMLGLLISTLGHVTIEQKVSRSVFLHRLAAATLITAAIALYCLS